MIHLCKNVLFDVIERKQVVSSLRKCLIYPGYFYLTTEIVSDDLLRKCYSHSAAFFSKDVEIKEKYKTCLENDSRGWIPMFDEPSYEKGTVSYVEGFDLAADISRDNPLSSIPNLGPNIFPDKELPMFRHDVSQLYSALTNVSDILYELIAESLNLEGKFFLKHATEKRHGHMRLLYYPGVVQQSIPLMITRAMRANLIQLGYSMENIKTMSPSTAHELIAAKRISTNMFSPSETVVNVGISAHTDFECFTFLHQSDVGLELEMPDGSWVRASPPAVTNGTACFTVIFGDMLERWTNGLVRATRHRVPLVSHPRYSIVRFNGLDGETLVAPLPQFVPPGTQPRFAPVTQSQHIANAMKQGLSNLGSVKDLIAKDV